MVICTGCSGPQVQRPAMGPDAMTFCQAPAGFFSNYGKAMGEYQAPLPALSSLLWEGELLAFGVDTVELESSSGGNLTVTPWVAGQSRDDILELVPKDQRCDRGRWRFTTSWDGMLLNGVVAGILWTGGMVLPAAQRDEYSIMFTDDGDLAVRYIGRMAGAFFWVFPMYIKDSEVWFVYARVEEPTVQKPVPQ